MVGGLAKMASAGGLGSPLGLFPYLASGVRQNGDWVDRAWGVAGGWLLARGVAAVRLYGEWGCSPIWRVYRLGLATGGGVPPGRQYGEWTTMDSPLLGRPMKKSPPAICAGGVLGCVLRGGSEPQGGYQSSTRDRPRAAARAPAAPEKIKPTFTAHAASGFETHWPVAIMA